MIVNKSVGITRLIMIICAFLFTLPTLCAAESPPDIAGKEWAQDLGHNFWLVMVAKSADNSFESIAHYRFCFYRNQNLGICNEILPSPSGRYAILQLSKTGEIVFFDTRIGNLEHIADGSTGLLRQVLWDDNEQGAKYGVGVSSEQLQ